MMDQRGALHRLLRAVDFFKINVVKQDSAVIDQEHHYSVEMVCDWRTSLSPRQSPTPSSVFDRYSEMACRIPVHDLRYIRLYEQVLIHCGELLRYDDALGTWLPSVTMVPFMPVHTGGNARPVTIQRDGRRRFITIHKSQLERVLSYTGYKSDEEMAYVLSSDPNHRMLRVFFPRKESRRRLIQVGFRHLDAPGALLEITGVLERTKFNILTSLVRHKANFENSLECLLEFEGDEKLPEHFLVDTKPKDGDGEGNPSRTRKSPAEVQQEHWKWCREILAKHMDRDLEKLLRTYNVRVGPPEYPRLQGSSDDYQKITLRASETEQKPSEFSSRLKQIGPSSADQVVQMIDRMKIATLPLPEAQRSRIQVMERLRERLRHQQPHVFLSYPETARLHASMIRKALESHTGANGQAEPLFVVKDYMSTNFLQVVDSVRGRISQCDYFIGIWHHEKEIGVSPWLPFEYGMAVATGKKCLVVYSEQLPSEIWNRIDPGNSKMAYKDVEFTQVVEQVKTHCISVWLSEWDPGPPIV
jgi:hypothetical protein